MWCRAASCGASGIAPSFEDLDVEVRPLLFHGCAVDAHAVCLHKVSSNARDGFVKESLPSSSSVMKVPCRRTPWKPFGNGSVSPPLHPTLPSPALQKIGVESPTPAHKFPNLRSGICMPASILDLFRAGVPGMNQGDIKGDILEG